MASPKDEDSRQEIEQQLAATLKAAGGDGCLYALDIDSGAAVGLHPHQLAVAASVYKVAVALELYRQWAVEGLDLAEQVEINDENRTPGPSGLSLMQDPARLSLRDLASLMLAVSDNAATDAIIKRVGLDRVNALMQELGLRDTVFVHNLRDLLNSIAADAGLPTFAALWSLPEDERNARLDQARALRAVTATRTTAYDMARLLQGIWLDTAAPAAACAEVRRLLSQQASYRIAVGFASGISVQAKSGSLMGKVRNEIGVVTYPDGQRFAVAVFTTAYKRAARQPLIDQAIGTVAACAVEHLRGRYRRGRAAS